MEGLGKRKQREDSDEYGEEENSSSDQDNDELQYKTRKRVRHDSQSEDVDLENGDEQREGQELDEEYEDDGQQLTEEQRLWLEARNELMKEDDIFKNLSKEELYRILNDNEQPEEMKFSSNSIKKLINNLKEKLNANQEKRLKFKDEPEQFLDSEAELHTALKEIQVISAFPEMIEFFIKNEGVHVLIEVLDHQNPDIFIESITSLQEMTEEDVVEKDQIVQIMMQNEVWNFLARIIQKLNDQDEDERKHLFKCLQLLENLLDYAQVEVSNKIMHIDTLIDWFIEFLNEGDVKSENYLQIAELLSIIIQNCSTDYKSKFAITLQGMERILSILNRYRKEKQLEIEEELEAVANLFDIISALLLVQENLDVFRKLQAFELLFSLIKKQKHLRRHIIKVFDFALGINHLLNTKKNCKYFIEKGGLPLIFGFFMLKQDNEEKQKPKKSKIQKQLYVKLTNDEIQDDEKYVLRILISLLINSEPDESDSQVIYERVLFKFIENDFEKLQRLFELHLKYYSKIEEFDLSQFKDQEEIEYLIQDYGFTILELTDFLIGYLFQSDVAIRLSEGDPIDAKIKEFMKLNGIEKSFIKEVIRIFIIRNSTADDEQNQNPLLDKANKFINQFD